MSVSASRRMTRSVNHPGDSPPSAVAAIEQSTGGRCDVRAADLADIYDSRKACVIKPSASGPRSESSASFEYLFSAHYLAIYRYCVRRLGFADAEDAAAEVFAVAWRRLDDVPDDDQSRAWLYSVAHRTVSNQYRSRARRSKLSHRLESTAHDDRFDAFIDEHADFEQLYTALDQLGRADRELLILSSWDGLTRTEIAQVLHIRENAVDQRLHRARKRLKEKLGRFGIQLDLGREEAPA
ncbi:MAG: sigma-70 family RNA polymerase sigma factor [Acidimicrobiia bacterium]